MSDAALLDRPVAPAPAPAQALHPQMPIQKCMVVFLFTRPDDPTSHTGRCFLQGVPELRTEHDVKQTEAAILQQAAGAMTSVVVIDWKRLDG